MQVRIGATDGNTYESVVMTDEEIQDFLDACEGRVGTGKFEDLVIKTPDEFYEFMNEFLKGKDGFSPDNITLYMEGDKQRVFPMDQVVWWEIDR